ncbi:MAG: hypothetical protein KAT43_02450 [Nanoarchaeota archaeon]|nr:hypothetical protein [Nanoarchaeota archaeon]
MGKEVEEFIRGHGLDPKDRNLLKFLEICAMNPDLDLDHEVDRWKFLRTFVGGDFNQFEILLAHDLSQQGTRNKAMFYEAIGELCDRLGHKAFLPHKFVGSPEDKTELSPRDTYVLTNDIMVPQVQLVLAYMGIPSPDVENISARAMDFEKPIIYFWEKGPQMQLHKYDRILAYFSFVAPQGCLDRLEQEITKFYEA